MPGCGSYLDEIVDCASVLKDHFAQAYLQKDHPIARIQQQVRLEMVGLTTCYLRPTGIRSGINRLTNVRTLCRNVYKKKKKG
jgi:hypothetical protein